MARNNGNKNVYFSAVIGAMIVTILLKPIYFFAIIISYGIVGSILSAFGIHYAFAVLVGLAVFMLWAAVLWIKYKPKRKPKIEITETQVYNIISYLKSKKQKQAVWVFVNSGECYIYSSKLGGEYYGEKVDGLQFLGQINFDEVPHIDGYPKTGLLQFFIDSQTVNQIKHKCILRYFKTVKKTENKKYKTEAADGGGENCNPLNYKDMPLSFEKFTDHIIYGSDGEFDGIFAEITERVLGKSYDYSDFENTPLFRDTFHREFIEWRGCKIGGNPANPWGSGGKHTELLFECPFIKNFANMRNSSNETNDRQSPIKPPIAWGGSGVADFFISESDLNALNFDDVLFVWER